RQSSELHSFISVPVLPQVHRPRRPIRKPEAPLSLLSAHAPGPVRRARTLCDEIQRSLSRVPIIDRPAKGTFGVSAAQRAATRLPELSARRNRAAFTVDHGRRGTSSAKSSFNESRKESEALATADRNF